MKCNSPTPVSQRLSDEKKRYKDRKAPSSSPPQDEYLEKKKEDKGRGRGLCWVDKMIWEFMLEGKCSSERETSEEPIHKYRHINATNTWHATDRTRGIRTGLS